MDDGKFNERIKLESANNSQPGVLSSSLPSQGDIEPNQNGGDEAMDQKWRKWVYGCDYTYSSPLIFIVIIEFAITKQDQIEEYVKSESDEPKDQQNQQNQHDQQDQAIDDAISINEHSNSNNTE
ncbi:unnamed protein product [Candida parapsilosis]